MSNLLKDNKEITKYWDYEKNGNLKPENVLYGSYKKYWWKCSKCHYEWETAIYNRTKLHTKCPKCGNKEGK